MAVSVPLCLVNGTGSSIADAAEPPDAADAAAEQPPDHDAEVARPRPPGASSGVRQTRAPARSMRRTGQNRHQSATWAAVTAPVWTAKGTAPTRMKKIPQPRNLRSTRMPQG